MSVIDEVLAANEIYSRTHELRKLTPRPERKLAVLTCMDTRLSIRTLGLREGDAHIIRNAGGIVTEDALRSLIISHHLLGTQEFIIINHTDCGMLTFKDEDLTAKLESETNASAVSPSRFYAFPDLEKNVRQQIQRVKAHPWIPEHISVRGFVYDVKTGKLNEVEADAKARGKAAK